MRAAAARRGGDTAGVAERYVAGGTSESGRRCRRLAAARFARVRGPDRLGAGIDGAAAGGPGRRPRLRRVRRRAVGDRRRRRLRGAVGVAVGHPAGRPGPAHGRRVPRRGDQPGVRRAGDRQDVVQARPDRRDRRHHPGPDHPRRLRPRPGRVHRSGPPALGAATQVGGHPAVRAGRGDVPPRPGPPAAPAPPLPAPPTRSTGTRSRPAPRGSRPPCAATSPSSR